MSATFSARSSATKPARGSVRRSAVFGAYVSCFFAFIPLYLTGPAYKLSLPTMGAILSGFGLISFLSTVTVPLISDRLGRKPVLILTTLAISGTAFVPALGLPLPLTVALFISLNVGGGAIPIVLAVIPTETVPRTIAATAVAVPIFAFEIFGSFISPIVDSALQGGRGDECAAGTRLVPAI